MAELNLKTPTGYDGQPGTQSKMGVIRLATDAEATDATSNRVALTPSNGVLAVPAASETVAGKVFLATNAEAVTGSNSTDAIVPSSLTARLAAPGAIGGTTPAAGTFTNLTINDVFSMDGGAATDFIGTATLVAGTVTVANTAITAADRILITRNALNASPVLGELIYTISAGVGFTVDSFDATGVAAVADVSGFSYIIVRQI